MSKVEKYNVPCPNCKVISEQSIYHSINDDFKNVVQKLLNNEINFVTCIECGNKFQVKTGLLYCNHSKQFAVYYHPNNFTEIEKEIIELKKIFGEHSYMANIHKYSNWEKFTNKIHDLECPRQHKMLFHNNNKDIFNPLYDKFWTCDICDGDSTTGCLYFDPTECPKFS